MTVDWDDATNIARLRDLWAAGHSSQQIANMMGCTKNSIVGKAHRLKLPSRPSPIIRTGERRPQQVQRAPATPKQLAARPLFVPPLPVLAPRVVIDQAKRCCWPVGEPGAPGFRFCNAAGVVKHRPYCEEHAARAYVKVRTDVPGYA